MNSHCYQSLRFLITLNFLQNPKALGNVCVVGGGGSIYFFLVNVFRYQVLCAMLMLVLVERKCDFLPESMINKFPDTLPRLSVSVLLALG